MSEDDEATGSAPGAFSGRYWALVREVVITVLVAVVLVLLARFVAGRGGGFLSLFGLVTVVSVVLTALGLGLIAAQLRRDHSRVFLVAWVAIVGVVGGALSVGVVVAFVIPGGGEAVELAMMIQGFSSLIIVAAMILTSVAFHAWSAHRQRRLRF